MDLKEEFILRFDVKSGEIPLDLFITSANCVKQIASDISKCIFEQPPKININVKVPRNGSFVDVLTMILDSEILKAGIALKILDTSEVRAFIRGLTGHEYPYYTNKAGVLLKNLIKYFLKKKPRDLDGVFEFDKAANLRQKFEVSLREKHKFYKKLKENKQVENIGFSYSGDYDINREDFGLYADYPEEYQNMVESKIYENGIKYVRRILKIVKPVTDKESNAAWNFKDMRTNESVSATMEDNSFRAKFYYEGMFPLKRTGADDILDVHIEYEELGGRTKSNKIITVFKFNDIVLEEPPDDLKVYQVTLDRNMGQSILNFDNNN